MHVRIIHGKCSSEGHSAMWPTGELRIGQQLPPEMEADTNEEVWVSPS
jgi:hypothetical protein